jgi:plasmid replication initiation protein
MSFGNEKKLNKYLPVVIGKDLAQARFSMDLWERRLMYTCMSKLKPSDATFPVISFTISEIAKLLDVDSLPATEYKAIKKAAKKLVTRVVEIDEKGTFEIYNWVSYFKLDTRANQISMQFNEYMKPYLLELLENKGYAKFLLKFAMPLGSTYAQRFYEMFRCLVYDGQPKAVQRIELQELRKRLEMADTKYKNFHLFKLRVLDLAEREINQKTDIYISFKEIRRQSQGRAVEALYVSVILKANMVHEWDKYMLWQKDDLLEKLYQIVEKKKGQKLHLEELEKYSHESIARLVFEILDGSINLLEINNHQKFIEWQLQQWQTDIGMKQLRIEDAIE